ncbi:MAG TPA: LptE family protein [Candidatus Angelobacter sp.]|nr:LptE family protein [Candidatus Angelobacter sp.]
MKRRLHINRLPIRGAMLIIAQKDLTKPLVSLFPAITALLALAALIGCGYHVAGKATRLPPNVSTIAVPMFVNQTQTYRIEQILTRDVVRELVARTHYHVVNNAGQDADLVLKGTVVSAQAAPLTYDAQSGRISSAVVTVSMKVSLTDHRGRVFFENQNYSFRQEYQVSREVKSFFEEETPALQRMSQDFARTLVSDVLEAY